MFHSNVQYHQEYDVFQLAVESLRRVASVFAAEPVLPLNSHSVRDVLSTRPCCGFLPFWMSAFLSQGFERGLRSGSTNGMKVASCPLPSMVQHVRWISENPYFSGSGQWAVMTVDCSGELKPQSVYSDCRKNHNLRQTLLSPIQIRWFSMSSYLT